MCFTQKKNEIRLQDLIKWAKWQSRGPLVSIKPSSVSLCPLQPPGSLEGDSFILYMYPLHSTRLRPIPYCSVLNCMSSPLFPVPYRLTHSTIKRKKPSKQSLKIKKGYFSHKNWFEIISNLKAENLKSGWKQRFPFFRFLFLSNQSCCRRRVSVRERIIAEHIARRW